MNEKEDREDLIRLVLDAPELDNLILSAYIDGLQSARQPERPIPAGERPGSPTDTHRRLDRP